MKRLLMLWIAALGLVGCKTSPPAGDPFMRTTTVPPPGTGYAPGDPYYPGGAAPPGEFAPSAQPPTVYPGAAPGLTPTPGNRYAPPGGSFNLQQSSTQEPETFESLAGTAREPESEEDSLAPEEFADIEIASDDSTAKPRAMAPRASSRQADVDVESNAVQLASATIEQTGTVLRIVGTAPDSGEVTPRATLAAGVQRQTPTIVAAAPQETALVVRSFPASPAAVPAETADLAKSEFRRRRAADIVQASYAAPVESGETASGRTTIRPAIVGNSSAATQAGAPYAHATGYEWLHGRLEYSQSARQWKIRYIPIDGQTDQYGGSMVLSNLPDLDGFKPGDFVAVQGAVGAKSPSRGFSPTFALRHIEPLRQ